MIPSSLVIYDGLRKLHSRSREINQCPKVWVGELNHVQGGTSQNRVCVKVVKLEKAQKVGKRFEFDLGPRLANVP